jgi:hypothetical protein
MEVIMDSLIEAQERIPNLRQQILDKLIAAGDKGITNIEFQKMCVRWNSRLSELYARGYKTKVICEGDGVYRYILTEQPEQIKKPKNALNILLGEIKNNYDDIICAEDLKKILAENNFIISRKGGSYKSA